MAKSKFLNIICPRCKKECTVYGKSSTKVKCPSCNYLLLHTQGGKARIRALIKKILP